MFVLPELEPIEAYEASLPEQAFAYAGNTLAGVNVEVEVMLIPKWELVATADTAETQLPRGFIATMAVSQCIAAAEVYGDVGIQQVRLRSIPVFGVGSVELSAYALQTSMVPDEVSIDAAGDFDEPETVWRDEVLMLQAYPKDSDESESEPEYTLVEAQNGTTLSNTQAEKVVDYLRHLDGLLAYHALASTAYAVGDFTNFEVAENAQCAQRGLLAFAPYELEVVTPSTRQELLN